MGPTLGRKPPWRSGFATNCSPAVQNSIGAPRNHRQKASPSNHWAQADVSSCSVIWRISKCACNSFELQVDVIVRTCRPVPIAKATKASHHETVASQTLAAIHDHLAWAGGSLVLDRRPQ